MSHVKLFIMISYMYTIIVVCEYVYVLVTCLCAVRQRINNESNLHLITNGPHGPCPCDSLIMLIFYQKYNKKKKPNKQTYKTKQFSKFCSLLMTYCDSSFSTGAVCYCPASCELICSRSWKRSWVAWLLIFEICKVYKASTYVSCLRYLSTKLIEWEKDHNGVLPGRN